MRKAVLSPLGLSAATVALIALLAAGCGGGGGSSAPAGGPLPPAVGGSRPMAQSLGVTLGGSLPTTFLASASRRAQSTQGIAVSVLYRGATVASGTLDGTGFAKLSFTAPVPQGATVQVAFGNRGIVATLPLATGTAGTAAAVTYQKNGTLLVQVAADSSGSGQITSGDQQEATLQESSTGQVESEDDQNGGTIVDGIPVTISVCTAANAQPSTITVAPAPSAPPNLSLIFAERANDDDQNPPLLSVVQNFDGPQTYPVLPGEPRVLIVVYQSGANAGEPTVIMAPVAELAQPSSDASPSPAPSSCPTLSPNATSPPAPLPTGLPTALPAGIPSTSPEPSESPESPEPSESPESPEPSESPESPAPSASPASSPAASASPSASASP
jgi:hypothetical protein